MYIHKNKSNNANVNKQEQEQQCNVLCIIVSIRILSLLLFFLCILYHYHSIVTPLLVYPLSLSYEFYHCYSSSCVSFIIIIPYVFHSGKGIQADKVPAFFTETLCRCWPFSPHSWLGCLSGLVLGTLWYCAVWCVFYGVGQFVVLYCMMRVLWYCLVFTFCLVL